MHVEQINRTNIVKLPIAQSCRNVVKCIQSSHMRCDIETIFESAQSGDRNGTCNRSILSAALFVWHNLPYQIPYRHFLPRLWNESRVFFCCDAPFFDSFLLSPALGIRCPDWASPDLVLVSSKKVAVSNIAVELRGDYDCRMAFPHAHTRYPHRCFFTRKQCRLSRVAIHHSFFLVEIT